VRPLGIVILVVAAYTQNCLALTPDEADLVNRAIASRAPVVPLEDRMAIKAIGSEALDPIAAAYAEGDEAQKIRLASLLWHLGLENEKAADVLLKDAKTDHTELRLMVQYALGSVSGDRIVVETLLDNMRHDKRALFRDKAACALANDQRHLDYQQRYYLYRGLIDGLGDELYQVRDISIRALQIHLGQRMGYDPAGSPEERNASIASWNEWLKEYQQSI